MTDDTTELRALAERCPAGPITIEPHGDGEALYFGRDDQHHGLNIVHLVEPASQWPAVRAYLAALSPARVLALLDEIERLREAVREASAYHGRGCGCLACTALDAPAGGDR